MVRFTLKKLLFHLSICLLGYFLILQFSRLGKVYAGWFSGFLAACYLLAGWLAYLKSKGTDLGKLIRRKRPPEVPYYLRNVQKERKPRQASMAPATRLMMTLRKLPKSSSRQLHRTCTSGRVPLPLQQTAF